MDSEARGEISHNQPLGSKITGETHQIKEQEMDQQNTNQQNQVETNIGESVHPAETQEGWFYAGHGEWIQIETEQSSFHHGNMLKEQPAWVRQWLVKNDKDIQIHHLVKEKGYPNRWGAQVEVQSRWNLGRFTELLQDYEDKEVVEWLRYGWPTGRLPTAPATTLNTKNHKGAMDFPQDLRDYLDKEASYGAIMGPYDKIPFSGNVGISPLSTRAKKDSRERRVILDLSFPIGGAVNSHIPKDSYLGFVAKLTFPKTDDFAFRIFELGKGCCMFKIDLSRYFRQIPLDPGDYSLIGYVIDGQIYFDKVLPMGMRSAPYIAQRITNAIAFIHRQLSYFLLNYVDDFVGAELRQKAWAAYEALTRILEELRVETSKGKLVPPTKKLEFLTITFDSETMTMEISQDKLEEIRKELHTWLHRTSAKR